MVVIKSKNHPENLSDSDEREPESEQDFPE